MYLLAVVGGVLAGIINTLAGSGSLVTLPILVALGLPAPLANGTNRVGIVLQSLVGLVTMKRTDQLNLTGSPWFVAPSMVGAGAGAWVASTLDAKTMNGVIFGVMIAMLGLILLDPKRWLREHSSDTAHKPTWWLVLVFVGVGFYGGFLQAGVGVMLLVGLVMGAGFSLRHANGIKLVIALGFTSLALAVFATQGLVDWRLGALMAIGQSIGAWIGVKFLLQHEQAPRWIRRLLIVIVCLGIARFGWTLFGPLS